MAQREKLYTVEEFWEIARLPENEDRRLELEDGVIVEMAASTPLNTVTAMPIGHYLNAFVIPRDLGYVTGADGGFKLAARCSRQPDVGFIAKSRLPNLPRRFEVPPDLAVEIVSEDEDIFKKAREYLHAGTKLVWAVYTDERAVYVMKLGDNGAIISLPFHEGDTLDGGEALPGFTLLVKGIFPG
jgi:Uma2 family endonuclease